MPLFVIGVSGVTCGGKSTLTQLLRLTFPGCRLLYQDSYFYDDDDPHHVRLPEIENHANYELLTALDMNKMRDDLSQLLSALADGKGAEPGSNLPGSVDGQGEGEEELPFFEGHDFVKNAAADIDAAESASLSRHKDVTILLIEGYLLFGLDYIYDACDVRLFLKLDREECSRRRSLRTTYTPPDVPGYFEKCVWVEYSKHYNECISVKDGTGIHVLDGSTNISDIRRKSVDIILAEMNKKFPI